MNDFRDVRLRIEAMRKQPNIRDAPPDILRITIGRISYLFPRHGLGYVSDNSDRVNEITNDVREFTGRLAHLFAMMRPSADAPYRLHGGQGWTIAQRNSKQSCTAPRVLYGTLIVAKACYRALLHRAFKDGVVCGPPHHAHSCFKGRRRETAIKAQLWMQCRLDRSGWSQAVDYYDAVNAFHCLENNHIDNVVLVFVASIEETQRFAPRPTKATSSRTLGLPSSRVIASPRLSSTTRTRPHSTRLRRTFLLERLTVLLLRPLISHSFLAARPPSLMMYLADTLLLTTEDLETRRRDTSECLAMELEKTNAKRNKDKATHTVILRGKGSVANTRNHYGPSLRVTALRKHYILDRICPTTAPPHR